MLCLKQFTHKFGLDYGVGIYSLHAQKKGMIGELLLHIIITEVLNEFTIDSPFFNTEERNVKKGFDVVLSKTGSTELWLAEVKSGNIHANKDVSQTAVELINTAQNDLNGKISDSGTLLDRQTERGMVSV